MIPKNIHMIWFQGWSELPERFQENVDSIIKQNPDWILHRWDDKTLQQAIAQLGQTYLDKYNGFKLLHQKVDFGRYCVLYLYGGVSVDTDVFAFKGFDETPHLNDSDFIVSYFDDMQLINNATILVSKNNPIMKGFIDGIKEDCGNTKSDFVCMQQTTAPDSFTSYLQPFKDQITILDSKYFEPCSGADAFCEIPTNIAITDHRHEMSWWKPWQKDVAKMYYGARYYKSEIFTVVVIVVVAYVIVSVFES